MGTIRIYTRRMALYLMGVGYQPLKEVPDRKTECFLNWIFPDIPGVRAAMTEYTQIFYGK